MPKVTSISLAGLEMWFWSHDHEPPHFHAKKIGAWEVRVRFLEAEAGMFEIKWEKKAMTAAYRRKIRRLVEEHRSELLMEWSDKVLPR